MSEPQRINEILPSAVEVIRQRCNAYRAEKGLPPLEAEKARKRQQNEQAARIRAATGDFLSKRGSKKAGQRNHREAVRTGQLW
jgi:hypothetical protein